MRGRLAIVLVLVVGCGGGAIGTPAPGAQSLQPTPGSTPSSSTTVAPSLATATAVTSATTAPTPATSAPPATEPPAPPFSAGQTFPLNATPSNLTKADLNGDRHLDLAIASGDTDVVIVALGRGDGTFGRATAVPALGADIVQVADIDGDGSPDLVVGGFKALAVVRGKGDGTFEAPDIYPVASESDPGATFWIATGDLNGDSRLDALLSFYGSDGIDAGAPGTLNVFINHGDGNLGSAVAYNCPACVAVAAGDFDEDGNVDAVTTGFGGPILLWRGAGDGIFGDSVLINETASPVAMIAADLNNDGHLDLYTGNDASNTVAVMFGHGDGTFDDETRRPAGNTHSIDIADLDGDGDLDLISGGRGQAWVNSYLGDGSGVFTTTASIQTNGVKARGVVAGDFNEDGHPDLAVADETQNEVLILLAD